MSQSGVIPLGLSDHFITFCTRKIVKSRVNFHRFVKIPSLKNYSKENCIAELTEADWSSCFYSSNVNDAWNNFQKVFSDLLDKIAPLKEIKLKNQTEPWIDSNILDLIQRREKAYI